MSTLSFANGVCSNCGSSALVPVANGTRCNQCGAHLKGRLDPPGNSYQSFPPPAPAPVEEVKKVVKKEESAKIVERVIEKPSKEESK